MPGKKGEGCWSTGCFDTFFAPLKTTQQPRFFLKFTLVQNY
ncbi:MAG: hypothetical protein ACOYVE_11700 [Melioribacter sp.]